MEDVDVLRAWIKSLRIQLQEKSPVFAHIERVQMGAIKFEREQIHFFYRRFHWRRRRPCLRSLIYYFGSDVYTRNCADRLFAGLLLILHRFCFYRRG